MGAELWREGAGFLVIFTELGRIASCLGLNPPPAKAVEFFEKKSKKLARFMGAAAITTAKHNANTRAKKGNFCPKRYTIYWFSAKG